jgi:hypothetical protein
MMRKPLLVFVCLILVVAPTPQALGESRYVTTQSLYVRMNPRGFFLGTIYINAGFHRRQTSGDYAYGWATGNYQGCGWVETAHTAAGGSTPANCSTSGFQGSGVESRQYLLANYAKNVNDYVANAATPLPLKEGGTSVRIKVGSVAGFYGNYRGGTFQNRVANLTLDHTSPIAWRWVSNDGRAVAVNLNPGTSSASWGFIPREDLPDKLPYSDGIDR